MTADTDVGIVLPVYNHAAFLERALAAIAAQTRAPAELIVVDDASTDASFEVAAAFAARLPPRTRFELIRNPANMGVNATLNRGLAAVRSPFVACTAADDWLRPDFIAALSAAAARFPAAGLVTSAYVEHFEAENRTVEHGRRDEDGVWYADEESFFDPAAVRRLWKRGAVTIPVSASIMRADALRAIGGFDPALKWHADWFVATTIALRHGFAVVPRHLAVFRVADNSFSGGNVRNTERQQAVCRALCDKLATAAFADVRRALRQHPSPFAPFIRHMIPATLSPPSHWPLLGGLAKWWIGQVFRGRRPGPLRAAAARLGLDVAPR